MGCRGTCKGTTYFLCCYLLSFDESWLIFFFLISKSWLILPSYTIKTTISFCICGWFISQKKSGPRHSLIRKINGLIVKLCFWFMITKIWFVGNLNSKGKVKEQAILNLNDAFWEFLVPGTIRLSNFIYYVPLWVLSYTHQVERVFSFVTLDLSYLNNE